MAPERQDSEGRPGAIDGALAKLGLVRVKRLQQFQAQPPLDALAGDSPEELARHRIRLDYERVSNEVKNEKLLTAVRNALGNRLPNLMAVETTAIFLIVIVGGFHAPCFNNAEVKGGWGFHVDEVTLRILVAATLAQVAALVALIVKSLYPTSSSSKKDGDGAAGDAKAKDKTEGSAGGKEETLPPALQTFLGEELTRMGDKGGDKTPEGGPGAEGTGKKEEKPKA